MSTVWCRVCGMVVSKFLAAVSPFLHHLFFGTRDDWQTSRPSWLLFLTGAPWFPGIVWQTFWVSAIVSQCLISSLYKFRASSWMGLWCSVFEVTSTVPRVLLLRPLSFRLPIRNWFLHVLQISLEKESGPVCRVHCPGTWLTISSYSKVRLFNSASSQLSCPFSRAVATPAFVQKEGRTHTVYFWIGFWGLRSATCSGCSFPYSLRISHVTHLA